MLRDLETGMCSVGAGASEGVDGAVYGAFASRTRVMRSAYRHPRRSRRRPMLRAVRRILVTGMSGTGKSVALATLGERGFEVVDTDEPGWTDWCDEDGGYLWREERIAELLAEKRRRTLYVSAPSRTRGASTRSSMPSYCSPHRPTSCSAGSSAGRRTVRQGRRRAGGHPPPPRRDRTAAPRDLHA